MSTSVRRRMAEQLYYSGRALFQEGLYSDALVELHRAEDAFRKLDARGHPFTNPLPNGVSGLANTLALSGLCSYELGNYETALTYFETSYINAKFEKKQPFRDFMQTLTDKMVTCYEKVSENIEADAVHRLLGREPAIDISFRFPYSLPPDVIPFARLYELAPERFPRYKDFYQRAQEKDTEIRRKSKSSDEAAMKRMSIYVWSILFSIWVVYGLIVLEVLTRKK